MKADWVKSSIEQICTLVTDGAHNSPKSVVSGEYMASVKDFSNYGFNFTGCRRISEEDYLKLKKQGCIPEKGDILVGKDGARFFEDIIIYKQDEKPALLSSIAILRPDNRIITPEFLYYTFKVPSIKKDVQDNYGSGSAIPRIVLKDFKRMQVSFPGIKEQKKITAIFERIDNKIKLNLEINDNLSQQLRLIFQHTFLDGEHPEWPVEKLGSFLSLERGLSYKGKFLSDSEGVPMINLGNILPNSVFRSEKLKYYTGDFKEKVIVKPGDIVVANTDLTQAREVLGSAILIPDLGYSTIICSHHISIVRKCQISKYFIHGMLNSPSYRERVVGFATGTTVLALPNETILNCDFSMPPSELIAEYDTIADSFYQKSEQLRKENQRLIVLRDFLLPRLMSGELDVTEVLL